MAKLCRADDALVPPQLAHGRPGQPGQRIGQRRIFIALQAAGKIFIQLLLIKPVFQAHHLAGCIPHRKKRFLNLIICHRFQRGGIAFFAAQIGQHCMADIVEIQFAVVIAVDIVYQFKIIGMQHQLRVCQFAAGEDGRNEFLAHAIYPAIFPHHFFGNALDGRM